MRRSDLCEVYCISDLSVITQRLNAVSELIQKDDMFYSLRSVISRFIDISHLLALCIQIPRTETWKTAEDKITHLIYLKNSLDLVEPLRQALSDCECPLLKAQLEVDCVHSRLLYSVHFSKLCITRTAGDQKKLFELYGISRYTMFFEWGKRKSGKVVRVIR